ncbi:flagellar hook-associated protein FlgK [Aneurinibacillus sp. Ricciae_BoGa-3]|uniref:flagellar hook-associated protein FlgK n=1 Tax=Aneurinibacillus sp. Ricciae_BoGa-3 TaxID=3022697 RepID=UPI002340FAEA|nr:flagellar hook-associated protein FlgK [Aneurinibacillus sp. Ricciae_BoGa-3]WCK54199.1 flagellar hook-associated protein FlgK [Aneurinibacillus sp. Ricciae_BoGa-3]
MGSTFAGLELAKRGLFAQQAALYTTGHNISNANTEGYTRQRVNLTATDSFPYPSIVNDRQAGQMGTGVTVDSVQRLREGFLDSQYRGENKNVGEFGARSDTLEKIETIMQEPSDSGLQHTMDQFWTSWQKLSQNPSDAATQEVVVQNGKAVAETFQFISSELKSLQHDVNDNVKVTADSMDTMAKNIASLNTQINNVVTNGNTPNDLYDQRDLLIDQLSNLADVTVTPVLNGTVDTGMVSVTVNGATLVDPNLASGYNTVSTVGNGTIADGSPKYDVQIGSTTLGVGSGNGKLNGLLTSRDQIIDDLSGNGNGYLNKINTLASTLINKVNSVTPFFSGTDASDIDVTANDASLTPSNPGDNTMALQVYSLKEDPAISFGTTTTSFDDYTRQIISALGVETQDAQRLRDNSKILVNDVDNRRQSVSGVSLDEEMSNMIKFQQAYNASARMMTTMDDVLDKVINNMGLVGR